MQTVENGAEILQQLASALGVTDADKDDDAFWKNEIKKAKTKIKQLQKSIKNEWHSIEVLGSSNQISKIDDALDAFKEMLK